MEGARGGIATNNWAIQYDGKTILDFMMEKENCTLQHARMVIENEGGYVDSKGVIHMGLAENKVGYID